MKQYQQQKSIGLGRELGKTPRCANPNTTENCTTPPLTLPLLLNLLSFTTA